MLSVRDRENYYKKAAGNCGVNIKDSTPAFFYGKFCKTLVRNPAKYGLPSMLGINRSSYRIWTYKQVTLECCNYFFDRDYHPRCSVALRWPNISDKYMGLLAAGYTPIKAFRQGYQTDVKLTNSEYTELLDAVNAGKVDQGKLTWNSSWFLLWRHIPEVDRYYTPRSRKIIDYAIRHKDWFNVNNNHRRIDEIFDVDITSISLKPEHIFERKDELKRLEEEKKNPLIKYPPFPYTLIEGIEYMDNSRKLFAEGLRMHHCVGQYSSACQRGESFILRLPSSTVEINISGNVSQHRAAYNRTPPPEDIDLLRKWKHERRRIEGKTATEVLNEQRY